MAEVRDLRQELASHRAPSGRVGEELRNERASVRVGGAASQPPAGFSYSDGFLTPMSMSNATRTTAPTKLSLSKCCW